MDKKEKLYTGKAKVVYSTNDPDLVVIEYTDQATAFNGEKKENIEDKGMLNAAITAQIFPMLEKAGVPTHFVAAEGKDILAKKLRILPIEVIVRNLAAGSMAKRLGLEEGTKLACPVLEYCYKNDELGDPMINNFHVLALGWATAQQLARVEELTWKINKELVAYFDKLGITLVDFKLEFGVYKGEVLLGDEISPDTCRFWDKNTGEKLDKDRFRRDLGGVADAYRNVLSRIQGEQ